MRSKPRQSNKELPPSRRRSSSDRCFPLSPPRPNPSSRASFVSPSLTFARFATPANTGMELIVASSSIDTDIGCWDLVSGVEQCRFQSCASPPHGLVSVSRRFLASSQLRENPSSSVAPIFYWAWEKPQVQVKSFPAEPIGPLVSNFDGVYIIGGGLSGTIYLWEVTSGKLLIKWTAHYRAVTCLTLSDDGALLISGSEDGSIRIWALMMLFDDLSKESRENIYIYSFAEHALPVTSVISGLRCSIIISSSEDRTCKVWSFLEGRLLRSITFPFIIDAITMDPWEHILYAGCRDGKIYIVALNVDWDPIRNSEKNIIDSLSDNSKAITCLAFSTDGVTLVSGSEDGTIRVWNTRTRQMTRLLKHSKAPISNLLIFKQPSKISQASSSRKHEQLLTAPPLDKYTDSREDEVESTTVIMPRQYPNDFDNHNYSVAAEFMFRHAKELQQNASAAVQMELERLKAECETSKQTEFGKIKTRM